MKKESITIIKITFFLVLFIGILLFIYLIKNKYEEVEILSIKQEYNLVLTSNDDIVNIPLYFKRDNSYLSKEDYIDSISLSNDNSLLKGKLNSIDEGAISKYNDDTYYEFIYSISFPSYDDFNEPLYINDCMFNISYKNGTKLSFEIGNISILFNSNINNNDSILITYLSAVTNEINGKLTIVGVNLSIFNNGNQHILLNSITLKNENYELDYMNYSLSRVDTKKNLLNEKGYSYYSNNLKKGNMNIKINSLDKVDIFIPLKYTNNIKIINNIPLYIDYDINNLNYEYIQDDFLFFKRIDPLNTYEVLSYVYKY